MTGSATSSPPAVLVARPGASPTWLRMKDAFRRHPTAIVGFIVLLLMVLMAIMAPYLGTTDPLSVVPTRRLKPPSEQF